MKVEIDGVIYCCGTCFNWNPDVGCMMPATPSTVNCGRTNYDDLCEQWAEITELDRFRAKIGTRKRRENRAAHYADGAINGVDL